MKDEIERKKRIGKIGAVFVLWLFLGLFFIPGVVADAESCEDVAGSKRFNIDWNSDDANAIFSVSHENDVELFRIEEVGGRVGIGDTDPDFKQEIAGSSGSGYFGVSSVANNDGDIFIIDSNGKVGIGTNNPRTPLEIDDNSGITQLKISYDANHYTDLKTTCQGFLSIYTLGNRVGIGTEHPSANLHITSGMATLHLESSDDDITAGHHIAAIRFMGKNNVGAMIVAEATGTYGDDWYSRPTALQFFTEDRNAGTSLGYPRMVIDEWGNIGIGLDAASPTAKVHIRQIGTADAFRVDDQDSDNTPFVIDQDGNVGIGTASPQRALHISDVMRLEPRPSPPSPADEGDIYVDSDDYHIFCYLNGEWKQLDNPP